MNPQSKTLFGTITSVLQPTLAWRGFTFSPAVARLPQSSGDYAPCVRSLADYAGLRAELIVADLEHDAPWARGRVEYLFHIRQDPKLTVGDTITPDGTFIDRNCMHFTFAAGTTLSGCDLMIPFVCSEGFGRTSLRFGTIPVRNANTYESLLNRLTNTFWDLLLDDPKSINDYVDAGSYFESEFTFGVRSGRPFFHWPSVAEDGR